MKIAVLGVPAGYGAGVGGCELAPGKLRELGITGGALKGFDVADYGDVHISETLNETEATHKKIKNYGLVEKYSKNTAKAVYEIACKDEFPLIIGGDHSISLGSISGISKAKGDIAVIWADAHGDLNTPETSASGNAHGMPGAMLLGEGPEVMRNILFNGNKLKAENLFLLGQRSIDPGEIEFINKKNIRAYTWDCIKEKGFDNILDAIFAELRERNIKHLHLSFDIDFLDAGLVPGTGTRVGNGPEIADAEMLLERIAASGLLKSMDFVELNPLLDIDGQTAEISIQLIKHVFKNLFSKT